MTSQLVAMCEVRDHTSIRCAVDHGLTAIAERDGNLLSMPFPGEPDGMDAEGRADLWRTKAMVDSDFRKHLETLSSKRARKTLLACLSTMLFMLGASLAVGIWASYLLDDKGTLPFSLCVKMFGFSLALSSIPLTIWVTSLVDGKPDDIRVLLGTTWKDTWVLRMPSLLQQAELNGLVVSDELLAFSAIMRNPGQLPSWEKVSVYDQVAMSSLCRNLEHQIRKLHKGAKLELGGESSELLHRVCGAALPGRLEALEEQFVSPPTVRL